MSEGRPPRAEIVNLVDNSVMPFLINPNTVQESIQANYTSLSPKGFSGQPLQYDNTGNLIVNIELYLSQEMQDRFGGINDMQPTIMQKRAWLLSLFFPRSDQDFSFAGPADILFNWPEVFRMKGRAKSLGINHTVFDNGTLRTTTMVQTIQMESQLDEMKHMKDIQIEGTLWESKAL